MTEELKPCPFCGTAPSEYDQIGYSSVKCHTCKFSIKVRSEDGPPYAPEIWNRRATLYPAHIEDERESAIAQFAQTFPMTSESAAGGNPYDIELRRYYLLGWDDRAALSAPPAAGVPEGLLADVLLREITARNEVLEALFNEFCRGGTPNWDHLFERARQLFVYAMPEPAHSFAVGKTGAPTPPASEQQQTVPRHKFEGLVEEVCLKDAEIARLAEQVMNLQAYRDGESGDGVWHWQGDGEDHLESLTCPIVIRAQDLRRLVASEQQRAVVMPEGKLLVSAEPLRKVLFALLGAPHHIRELQATRTPTDLFADNPINVLIAELNAAQGGDA